MHSGIGGQDGSRLRFSAIEVTDRSAVARSRELTINWVMSGHESPEAFARTVEYRARTHASSSLDELAVNFPTPKDGPDDVVMVEPSRLERPFTESEICR
jgi:hypothetical protein